MRYEDIVISEEVCSLEDSVELQFGFVGWLGGDGDWKARTETHLSIGDGVRFHIFIGRELFFAS